MLRTNVPAVRFTKAATERVEQAEDYGQPDAYRAAQAALATAYANLAGLAFVCPELFDGNDDEQEWTATRQAAGGW